MSLPGQPGWWPWASPGRWIIRIASMRRTGPRDGCDSYMDFSITVIQSHLRGERCLVLEEAPKALAAITIHSHPFPSSHLQTSVH